jgi:hypothetical protein
MRPWRATRPHPTQEGATGLGRTVQDETPGTGAPGYHVRTC